MTDESAPRLAPPGNVSILRQEIKRRTLRPAGEVVFWAYLIVGILGLGGFGVILEVVKLLLAQEREWGSLYTALLTYSPAIPHEAPTLRDLMLRVGASCYTSCNTSNYVFPSHNIS